MIGRKIILSLLMLSLFASLSLQQMVEAKSPVNPSLVLADTDQVPPSDEITKKYGFTLPQELILGRTVAYSLLEKYDNKINTDPELNRYVNLVGQSIAKAASNRPQVEYKFGIIDTDEINAFAAPGGYVFVTTGLLKVVYDENELAAVLAHEIGHVERGHGLQDIRTHNADQYAEITADNLEKNATIVSDVATSLPYAGWYASYYSPANMAKRGIGSAIGRVGGGYGGYVARSAAYTATDAAVDAASDGMKKLAKKFATKFIERMYDKPLTPEVEFEADAFSAEALGKVGYDPKGISSFLETVEYIKTKNSSAGEAQTGSTNLFTYRHPPISERKEKVELIVEKGEIIVKNPTAGTDEFFEERCSKKLESLK